MSVSLVLLGAFAGAWSAVFIRLSSLPPTLLAAYRLLIAAAVLAPLYFRDAARFSFRPTAESLRLVLVPGFLLACHFVSWNIGVRRTSVANSTLIVNMTPAAMPVFAYLLSKERLGGREILGTLTALAGAVLLTGSGFRLSRGTFPGDLVSFGSMILFTGYLAAAKKANRMPSITLYVAPLYLWAGLLCLLASFAAGPPWEVPHGHRDAAMASALAIVCTVGGHSLFNYGMKALRSQLVSLLVLTQAPWAALIAFFVFAEVPDLVFLPASLLMAAGILLTGGRT